MTTMTKNPKLPMNQMKEWLTVNSNYFSDELSLKQRRNPRTNVGIRTNQRQFWRVCCGVLALVDWDRRSPLLERMLNDTQQARSRRRWRAGIFYGTRGGEETMRPIHITT
jgi:hypothetical protein